MVIPEHLINGRRSARGQRPNQFNTTLAELTAGRPVVHLDFGIGRYQGIERRRIDGLEHDFIEVDFRGDDKVFVPVARIGSLDPMTEAAPRPSISSGQRLDQALCAGSQGLLEIAHRLVETQAKRDAFEVKPLPGAGQLAQQFEALFPFQPTADQEDAFGAHRQGPGDSQPMDRLVCGDVGFGKTESRCGQRLRRWQRVNKSPSWSRRPSCASSTSGALASVLERSNCASPTEPAQRHRRDQRDARGLRSGQIDVVIGTASCSGAPSSSNT